MTRAIIKNKKIVGFEPIREESVVDKDLIKRRQRAVVKWYNENKENEKENEECIFPI